jgi:hypothetical protein
MEAAGHKPLRSAFLAELFSDHHIGCFDERLGIIDFLEPDVRAFSIDASVPAGIWGAHSRAENIIP